METAARKNPRMVAMIPIRRCGSHALRLRLNVSAEFFSPYPLHIVDFLPLVPLYGDLNNDDNYRQLVTDVIGLQHALMVQWPYELDVNTVFNATKHLKRSVHSIVGDLLIEGGKMKNAKVVLDKSLDAVHYAEELVDLFPDMLFVLVVRDPRAQVSSMNQAIIHDFTSLPNAIAWTDAHTKARNLAQKYPERVCTVTFEDFIDKQEEVLQKICSFLEIQYLPEMIDIKHNSEAAEISKLSALWENNAQDPIIANKQKFLKYMNMEEIEVIETVAGDLMDEYGYAKMTPAKAQITPELIKKAKEESDAKKVKAWEKMHEADPRDFEARTIRKNYIEGIRLRLAAKSKALGTPAS